MDTKALNTELIEELDEELGVTLSRRQKLFVKYTMMVLIDLVVINLLSQFWDKVYIAAFHISLLAAILLQLLLQITMIIEHRIAGYFKQMSGLKAKIFRGLSTWAVLFGSKFAILWAINFSFGNDVQFHGALHGMVTFIALIVGIIVAEQVFNKVYRSLR